MNLIRLGGLWYSIEGFNLVLVDTPETEPAEGTFIDGDALSADLNGLDDITEVRTAVAATISEYEQARTEAGTSREALNALRSQVPTVAVANHILLAAEADAAATGGELPTVEGAEPAAAGEGGDEGGDPPPAPEGSAEGDGEGNEGGEPAAGEPTPEMVAAAAQLLNTGMLGQNGNVGAPGAPAASPRRREIAHVIAASAASGSEPMSDASLGEAMTRAASQLASSGGRQNLGRYEAFGAQPDLAVQASAGEGGIHQPSPIFRRARQILRMPEVERMAVQAAAIQADASADAVACTIADQRRDIADCGDMSNGLLGLFEVFPSPHCVVEYYVNDASLADVADGITVWDESRANAYAAARLAYLTALRAEPTDPAAISAAHATLKAAEKQCAEPKCIDRAKVTWTPIVACMAWPEALEYCSPETVRLFRRTMQRAFVREQNAAMLAYLASTAINVTVNAAEAPFTNSNGEQLDAALVIDHVITVTRSLGVVAERQTEGNYTAILPWGLSRLLQMSERKAEQFRDLSDALGVNTLAAIDFAAGIGSPWPALPAVGSTVDFAADIGTPSDWEIIVIDPDDYFIVQRPDIEVAAQMTPDSALGNYVFGGLQETFQGYGKDGCHPTWRFDFSNLCFNGARVAGISPAGLCESAPVAPPGG